MTVDLGALARRGSGLSGGFRLAARGTAWNGARRVVGQLVALSVADLKASEEHAAARQASVMAALLAAHHVSALPIPLGDPRSSIWGDPVARRLPEMPPKPGETASEPRRGGPIRLGAALRPTRDS